MASYVEGGKRCVLFSMKLTLSWMLRGGHGYNPGLGRELDLFRGGDSGKIHPARLWSLGER